MPTDPSSPWSLPSRFDDFEIVGPLRAGGMGVVFEARDLRGDRPAAIKVMSVPEAMNHARDRFALEILTLTGVRHPNVVEAYRAGVVDGRPYLAQELLIGDRLDEVSRPMPWRHVLAIGRGLARAVAAVHARGVIHRDIKPSNVMLVGGRDVKLFDFGLAVFADRRATDTPAPAPRLAEGSNDRLTALGGIAGTPAYLAPELWVGGAPSPRSDAYALGLVLYELLAGEIPFRDLARDELERAIADEDLPPIAARAEVPAAIGALIDRCVERDPARRAGRGPAAGSWPRGRRATSASRSRTTTPRPRSNRSHRREHARDRDDHARRRADSAHAVPSAWHGAR